MKKGKLTLGVFLLMAALAAGLIWNQARISEQNDANASVAAPAAAESGESAESDAKSMSIEGLELSQGEAGRLQWTLAAKQAEMAGQDGLIRAVEPYLTYFLRAALPQDESNRENILTVQSKLGEVDQERDLMRFIEAVRVSNADKRLFSELLEYSGGDRQLISPGHADFSARSMDGEADRVVWKLDENTLYAYGNVRVDWENVSRPGEMLQDPATPEPAE